MLLLDMPAVGVGQKPVMWICAQ